MRVELKCDGKTNPVAVSDIPQFSWKTILQKGDTAKFQTAYRIIVKAEDGELYWDTGIIDSDKSTFLNYQGTPLKSHEKYIWSVTVFDDLGNEYEGVGTFVTGIFDGDWKAKWIYSPNIQNAPQFIKRFNVDKDVKSAYAYISGLGYFELYINGKKVGDDYFVPNQTDYDEVKYIGLKYDFFGKTEKVLNYLGYDVKDYLKVGENTVEIILGNGFYKQKDRIVEGEFLYDDLKTIFELHFDGNILKSDETWTVKNSKIKYNNIFYGEVFDESFEDNQELNVELAKKPTGKFLPQFAPCDKVMEETTPKRIGEGLYDAGKCLTGFATIRVKGKSGDEVKVYYAEMLDGDGKLDFTSTVGYEESDKNQIQMDRYIIGSNEVETYSPHFVWHGFRYFSIVSENAEILDVSVKYIYTEMEVRTTFESSDSVLNDIHNLYINSQKSNTHGAVPMDCPTRERMGYTGDGQASSRSGMYSFSAHNFYKKWFLDIVGTQNKETGYVTHTAPFLGGGGGPMWGTAITIVAWNLYTIFGDEEVLEFTSNIKKWIGYLKSRRNAEGLVDREEEGSWCLGDWCLPTGEAWSEPQFDKIKIPSELVNTFSYIYSMKIYLKMLDAKGEKDIETERDLDSAIKTFNDAFLKDYYSEGTEGCDVFPLFSGIVPKEKEKSVFENLLENIKIKGNHFDTGLFGTGYMLYVLDRFGRNDLALELIKNEDYPGYGYMVKNGATALWETWEGNGSQNHTALGAFDSWIFECLSGIKPIAEKPGFKEFEVHPCFSDRLDFLRAKVNTDYGDITLRWKRDANIVLVNIGVPFNTTAHIKMGGMTYKKHCGEYEFIIDKSEIREVLK